MQNCQACPDTSHRPPGSSTPHRNPTIALFGEDPRPPGAKALPGRDGLRVRVGDDRILYLVHADVLVIVVGPLGHRKDVHDH